MDVVLAGLGLLAAAGCLFWLVGAFNAWRLTRVLPLLRELPAEPAPALVGERVRAGEGGWPLVSIIVPARDEAETIEAATATRLALDYPALELVLVDDRSVDGTGAIVDRLAAEDARVVALHVEELPAGWLGKTHALARGVDAARGEYLLFTDADVHFAPRALRRAIAFAASHGVEHLAVIPEVLSRGFLLDAVYATFGRYFALSQRLWRARGGIVPPKGAATGVGAFNLVRSAALERSEGLGWMRLDVADDLALALLLQRAGARAAVLNGLGEVRLAWYESLWGIVLGLEKNTFALFGCRLHRALLAAFGALALDLAPLVALLPLGIPGLRWLAILAIVAGLVSAALGARWSGRRVLPALLWPLGSALFAFILARSAVLGARRGGIVWRGTFHPSEELRRAMRVRV